MESHDNHIHGHTSTNSKHEYIKLYLVFAFILLLSILMSHAEGSWHWMILLDYVMGIFFLTFGLFKLFEFQTFANGYKAYDLIAQRLSVWGYIYPFVEIALGVLYILHIAPLWLNVFTVILLSINAIGVWRTTSRTSRHDMPHCLCLGSVIQLPLSTISLLENVLMGAMAMSMLVAFLIGIQHPVM